MKYLITGGAGFIGSNFVRYLYEHEKNVSVRVLDKMTYAASPQTITELKKFPRFTFLKGDICNPKIVSKAMNGVDVVVNFAAESAVDRSINDPGSFLDTDIKGVYVLLEEARRQKTLKRFVQISTDEVYGQILKGSFTETSDLKPRNPYAAAKLGGDRLAYSFYVTYGLPVIITRCANNYGPYHYPEKVIPLFITNLINGLKVPVYGRGKQIRDWLFVNDHCSAVHLLIKKGKNGEIYNIGGGKELTNMALTLEILKVMGKDKSWLTFVKDRPGHDFRYSLSISKLRKLGWKPQVNFKEGLSQTVDWYKNNESWWRPLKSKMDKKYVTGYWGQASK
jgi:dTDP-glucose 4,6-dehydratase